MTTATKQVGYAYPSSNTAIRLGFGREGCYFCRLMFNGGGWSERDRGFVTERAALQYADEMPEAYHQFSSRPETFVED